MVDMGHYMAYYWHELYPNHGVKFPYIRDSRYLLELKVSYGTVYRRSILKHVDT